MKPPNPTPAAVRAVKAIWANMADRAGLECLGEVEQRTAQHMRRELAAIIDRHFAKQAQDAARLDLLQWLTFGYGKGWVLRQSEGGRGWRLHESSRDDATPDVRQAIDKVGHVMGYRAEDVNWSAPERP